MKIQISLIVLSLVLYTQQQYNFKYDDYKLMLMNAMCPVYKCSNQLLESWAYDQCQDTFYYQDYSKTSRKSVIKVKKCAQNNAYCGNDNKCQFQNQVYNQDIGAECIFQGVYKENQQCSTGHCVNSKCAPLQQLGDYCLSTNWCASNLTCFQNQCVKPLQLNQSCDASNSDKCPWNTQCALFLNKTGNFSRCLPYFSLDDNVFINKTYPNTFFEKYKQQNDQFPELSLCKSGFQKSIGNGIFQCSPIAILQGNNYTNLNCQDDIDCQFIDPLTNYSINKVSKNLNGKCSSQFQILNINGQRFCYLQDSDQIEKNILFPGNNYLLSNLTLQFSNIDYNQCPAYKFVRQNENDCLNMYTIYQRQINPIINLNDQNAKNQSCYKYLTDAMQTGDPNQVISGFNNLYSDNSLYARYGNNIPVVCDDQLKQDYCLNYTDGKFKANKCQDGYFCRFVSTSQNFTNVTFTKYVYDNKLNKTVLGNQTIQQNISIPLGVCIKQTYFQNADNNDVINNTQQYYGKPCGNINSTCLSGYCNSSGLCDFVQPGDICLVNNNCQKGYQCTNYMNITENRDITKRCLKSIQEGQNCSYNTKTFCQQGTTCISVLSKGVNTTQCKKLFSLDKNDSCLLPYPTNSSYQIPMTQQKCDDSVCKSQVQVLTIDRYICLEKYEQTIGLQWPKRCSADYECVGNYYQTKGVCSCSVKNAEGAGFCQGFFFEKIDQQKYFNNLSQLNSSYCENYEYQTRYGENITQCQQKQITQQPIYDPDTKFESCITNFGQDISYSYNVATQQDIFGSNLRYYALYSILLILIVMFN